jgi:hypothetical protein
MSTILPPALSEATLRFEHAARDIIDTFEGRQSAKTSQITPAQLAEAIEQFLALITLIDEEQGKTGAVVQEDVTQLGDYGISLITDLISWTAQLNLPVPRHDLEIVILACADWIMRHEGQIRALDPVVNALANFSNRKHEPASLEPVADFMSRVVQASTSHIKQDLEKTNPSRPWRVLHLNRSIVATRTHNPELMEKIFEDFVHYFPEDAPAFFAEGMQQMDALNYPQPVRQIMERYFDRWTRPRMH